MSHSLINALQTIVRIFTIYFFANGKIAKFTFPEHKTFKKSKKRIKCYLRLEIIKDYYSSNLLLHLTPRFKFASTSLSRLFLLLIKFVFYEYLLFLKK